MNSQIFSHFVVTLDSRDSYESLIGLDVSATASGDLERIAEIESRGDGFVVTAYRGRLSDLPVDEETRLRLTPVTDLALSVRSMNCLRFAGISTVGELCEQTTEALLSVPNMGMKSVSEIRKRLSQLGLRDHLLGLKWRRTLDLRLLVSLPVIDESVAAVVAQTPYRFLSEICAADPVALKNRFGKHARQQISEATQRISFSFQPSI